MKILKLLERVAFLGDIHIPEEDPKCLDLVFNFLEHFQPKTIYLIGDILDVYDFQTHLKKADKYFRFNLERKKGKEFLARLRKVCPKAKIVWLDGNHENRLIRYIERNPDLQVFSEFINISNLLDLPSYDIDHHNYQAILRHGQNFIIEHGDIVRSGSSSTARGMLDKRLKSGISGHTHRLGVCYKTAFDTQFSWYENGCLCKINPEYIRGTPDWQHGFHVGYYDPVDDYMWMQQIPIQNYKIVFNEWIFT